MDKKSKLIDLIRDFDTAMLITDSNGKIVARPMAIAKVDEDGSIWFITDRDSGKVASLNEDRRVGLTMQVSRQFVSLSGVAEIHDDRVKIAAMWKEMWKIWFPKGKDDPSILLLKVDPSDGEYWDNSGLEGVKYLIEMGRAYFKGERPEVNEAVNASIKL